jgi:hypothetical protein
MIAELTHDMPDSQVAPQDEAMDCFRRNFKLVGRCNVTSDGKLMIYELKGWSSSAWYDAAKLNIKMFNLPLVAELVTDITGTFIHIIYKP